MQPVKDKAETARTAGPMAGQRLVICLSDPDYAALKRTATDMQKSAVKLSGELLEAIISSNIL
jgi:hypothetical protein